MTNLRMIPRLLAGALILAFPACALDEDGRLILSIPDRGGRGGSGGVGGSAGAGGFAGDDGSAGAGGFAGDDGSAGAGGLAGAGGSGGGGGFAGDDGSAGAGGFAGGGVGGSGGAGGFAGDDGSAGAGGFAGGGVGGSGGSAGVGGLGGSGATDSWCGLGGPPQNWTYVQPEVGAGPMPRGVGGTIRQGRYELTRFVEYGDTSACLVGSLRPRYQVLTLGANISTLVNEDSHYLHWPMTFVYGTNAERFLTTISCSPYGGTSGNNFPDGPFGPFETYTATDGQLTLFSPECGYHATYELRTP
jgi:hypothetical protein